MTRSESWAHSALVRAAVEEDMFGICCIEQASISPPWTQGALLSEIYNDDSLFALAVDKREILGFIILRCAADEGDLLQIAVDEKYRRCGIADLLMISSLSHAKENELQAVYLEVRKSNEGAIALYRKHGFRETGKRRDYYSDPIEDALVMAKDL